MNIHILLGDVTTFEGDAIVNAANSRLIAGGGVCGAIHSAAGPELEQASRALAPCPVGSAVITPGFNLPAKYVIHAAGPRWWGGERGEEQLLEKTYDSIYELVAKHHIKSVALPAIATGIYRFPLDRATRIALGQTSKNAEQLAGVDIVFACFDEATRTIYEETLRVAA